MTHFRDAAGAYLGVYGDGATPPVGAIACPAPMTAMDTWNGSDWDANIDPLDVREEGERRILMLGPEYTAAEKETWPRQEKEAEAYTALGVAAVTPLIDGIAAGRGVTRAEMAAHVLMKVAQFSQASGALLGKQAEILAMDPIPADFRDDSYWE